MSLRTKIASAILFIVVATAQFWKGFFLEPTFANCWTTVVISLGMVMVLTTNISLWLKLFLLVITANTIYAVNPQQTTLCLNGIVCFIFVYYLLTKITSKEIKDLVQVTLLLITIQAVWVLVEVLYVKNIHGFFHKSPDICGTIGYVNLVALLLASTIPLMMIYKRSFLIFALPALWFCSSYASLGALAVAMWIFFFEKSKRFIVFTLIALGIVCYIGIPKLKIDIRIPLWRSVLQQRSKENLIWGIGLGSFKDYPLVNINMIRQGLTEQAQKGNEDASYALSLVEGQRFPFEHRVVNLKEMFSKLDKGQERFEKLRGDIKPWMDNNTAFRAHNTFLNLLREGGILSLIPILGFVLMTLINFIRSEKTLLQRALFGALCGFYVGMFFDFPDRNLPTISLIMIIIAANTILVKKEA